MLKYFKREEKTLKTKESVFPWSFNMLNTNADILVSINLLMMR
jgi:hypothetical protein